MRPINSEDVEKARYDIYVMIENKGWRERHTTHEKEQLMRAEHLLGMFEERLRKDEEEE